MADERRHYRYYTVEEAARALSVTPARIREMVRTGALDSLPPGATQQGDWKVWLPVEESPDQATTHGGTTAETAEVPADDPDSPPAVTEVARQPDEKPRGEDAASNREPTSESGWVTTQQAARALGISARTVRWHIERGNLEAKPEGGGVERTWRVSVDSLNVFRDTRQRQQRSPRDYRASVAEADIAAAGPAGAVRELADRLVEEARRAEAARVRLELSERAQSSLEAELSEERQRREDAERERDAARRELEALHETREYAPESPPSPGPTQQPPPTDTGEGLHAAPEHTEDRRGFWSKLFGRGA